MAKRDNGNILITFKDKDMKHVIIPRAPPGSHKQRVATRFDRILHKPEPSLTIVYDIVDQYQDSGDMLCMRTSDDPNGPPIWKLNASIHIKGFDRSKKILPSKVTVYERPSRVRGFVKTWVAEYAENDKRKG